MCVVWLWIQTNDDQALLVVKDAKRDDSGPYTVVLKNPSGSAEATVKVTVIGTVHYCILLLIYLNKRYWRCDNSDNTHLSFAYTKEL